jgi:hypothetical protein
LSWNAALIDNHSIIAIVFNIFDTSLSSSTIDSVLFSNENLFFQITTITLQNFFDRARREIRQQVKNVYSYDSIINQIVRSFYNEAFSTRSSHLLFYLFTIVNIQISTSTIKEFKQRQKIDKSRNRLRKNDIDKKISRSWIFSRSSSRRSLNRHASTENYSFCNTTCTNSRMW